MNFQSSRVFFFLLITFIISHNKNITFREILKNLYAFIYFLDNKNEKKNQTTAYVNPIIKKTVLFLFSFHD